MFFCLWVFFLASLIDGYPVWRGWIRSWIGGTEAEVKCRGSLMAVPYLKDDTGLDLFYFSRKKYKNEKDYIRQLMNKISSPIQAPRALSFIPYGIFGGLDASKSYGCTQSRLIGKPWSWPDFRYWQVRPPAKGTKSCWTAGTKVRVFFFKFPSLLPCNIELGVPGEWWWKEILYWTFIRKDDRSMMRCRIWISSCIIFFPVSALLPSSPSS